MYAFEKRIKRNIIARKHHFFAATSPGLKKLCFKELSGLPLTEKKILIVDGGVEFTGFLHDCYLANLCLRTANRILIRIEEFKATNFRVLTKKTDAIPWELYLNSVPEISVSCKQSRMRHSKAISKHFIEGVKNALKKKEYNNKILQTLFIRVIDDNFIISIDSSGDLLHKRGIKKHISKAPIRETLAAAALFITGFDKKTPLIDPMCGSGTFSIEAAMKRFNIPPGMYRNFAFMEWPSFKESRWNHIKKNAEKQIIQNSNHSIFASDIDTKACTNLKNNMQDHFFSSIISIKKMNFFDMIPSKITDNKGVVLINPPYGQRLGTQKISQKLYHEIFNKLNQDFKGWKIGMIVSDKKMLTMMPFEINTHKLSHGGLTIYLIHGVVK